MPDNSKLEREQSVLRLAVVSLVFLYILFVGDMGGISTEEFKAAVGFGSVNIFSSILLGVFTWRGMLNRVVRRSFGIMLDVVSTTVIMYYLAEYGAPLFAVYLFVTIGNGFRYGIKYLVACTLLSIICFSYLSVSSEFWQGLYSIVISGIVVLTVVPAYVAVLLRRLTLEKARAEQASKEKSRFLANVSHEIRTPLNIVVGFSGMLGMSAHKAKHAQIVRSINDASKSLMALVEGVLDFSRIESGHVRIKKEIFNLYELVYSVEGMFSMHAEQGGIRYIMDLDISLPSYIRGDIDRLRQVLVNLVGNAVKFTTAGEVRLRIRKMHTGEEGEQLLFEVIDTGIGIPKALQSRIFERFRQADDSIQRRYGGTGLGTAIAKHLVDLMGGSIGVESKEHQGSRFWFNIPLSTVEKENRLVYETDSVRPVCCILTSGNLPVGVPADTRVFRSRNELDNSGIAMNECCVIVDAHHHAEHDGDITKYGRDTGACMVAYNEDDSKRDVFLYAGFHLVVNSFENIENILRYAVHVLGSRLRKKIRGDLSHYLKEGKQLRVLVADDCKLNRHVMKAILDELGAESDFASSGLMALEKLQDGTYDLLVLDIQMPGMSGFDVIETYQADNMGKKLVPIMVVTGDATTEIYDECDKLGVSQCLLKPVDQEKLRYAIASLVAPVEAQISPGIA